MRHYVLSALAIVALLLTSCDNSPSIGSSITADTVEIVTVSDFTVTGSTMPNNKVQSRTVIELLGAINADEYGSLYSDFVTQFMPSAQIETEGVVIDGLTLRMAIPKTAGIVGDSLAPMGLEVYELNRDLQYPIYSNFGEDVSNYYDSSNPIASKTYTFTTAGQSDSIQALSYVEISVPMPLELANRLFDIYKENQENYLIPERFAQKFPGIYVRSNFGNGRVSKIGATIMTMDYHVNDVNDEGKDTTYYYSGNYYAVSPEIITNNNINFEMSQSLKERYDNGENLLVAPIGLDMEIQFPINDILNNYIDNSGLISVVNGLAFTLPVEEIENEHGIAPPPYILMVRSDKKDEFFAKNQITDNLTSFLGTYNSTYNRYEFPDMRAYLVDQINKGAASPSEYTYTLTPVTVNTETNASSSYYYYGTTSTTVSSIVPYVETPAMAKILLDEAKIVLSYSKQTLKN